MYTTHEYIHFNPHNFEAHSKVKMYKHLYNHLKKIKILYKLL